MLVFLFVFLSIITNRRNIWLATGMPELLVALVRSVSNRFASPVIVCPLTRLFGLPQMNSIPKNVHTWSNTSKEVNSYTVSLTLRDKDGKPLPTSNFSSYVDIYIARNTSDLPEEEEFHVIPLGSKKYIQYHTVQVNSSNFSVHVQVRPKNESIGNLTVLLRYDERPTTETFDYNWTVPDFSTCSFKNVSNSSAGSEANNATNSSAPNSTQTGQETVEIDLKRDCVRNPYLVSISNSMVTEMGTYYLGRFHCILFHT